MSDVETVAEHVDDDGREYRAVIQSDDYAFNSPPDGDSYGIVLRVDTGGHSGRRFTVEHADYGQTDAAENLAERLERAYDGARDYAPATRNGAERDAMERAMRRAGAVDWHEFRSTSYQGGDDYLLVVTDAIIAAWGTPAELVAGIAESSAYDWQAWLDGDVYGARVETRVTWHADDGSGHTRTTWETFSDAELWGHYGREYAEEAARELLADYVPAAAS